MPVPTLAMATVGVPTVVMRGGRTWPQLATAVERLPRRDAAARDAADPSGRRRPRPRACLHCHDDPQLRQLRWHGFVPTDKALPMLANALAGLRCCTTSRTTRHSRPTKVLEYMASGVPVVSTANPSSRELVERHGCGLLVPFEDPAAAAAAVRRLTRTSPCAVPWVWSGRQAALRHYSWGRGRQGLRRPDRGVGRRADRFNPGVIRQSTPGPTHTAGW